MDVLALERGLDAVDEGGFPAAGWAKDHDVYGLEAERPVELPELVGADLPDPLRGEAAELVCIAEDRRKGVL